MEIESAICKGVTLILWSCKVFISLYLSLDSNVSPQALENVFLSKAVKNIV